MNDDAVAGSDEVAHGVGQVQLPLSVGGLQASQRWPEQIRSEDVPGLFPEAPKIAPGLKLFALHAADGTPIMLTDSREAAVANAWSNELQAVSVH